MPLLRLKSFIYLPSVLRDLTCAQNKLNLIQIMPRKLLHKPGLKSFEIFDIRSLHSFTSKL